MFVLKDGSLVQLPSDNQEFQQFLSVLPQSANILGFYIRFKSKTMPHARASYPNLGFSLPAYYQPCPLRLLRDIGKRGWVVTGFLKSISKGAPLKKYLQTLISSKQPVSPYALRIGGRTWNITHGLDRQFVDYLGTWKSPEASARYYRDREQF